MKIKKLNLVLIITNVILILFIIIVYKPYTQKDYDKVVDIYLEKVKPSMIDYFRLDMDNNNKITLYDSYKIIQKIK